LMRVSLIDILFLGLTRHCKERALRRHLRLRASAGEQSLSELGIALGISLRSRALPLQ
jgi:hypothetical protein